MVVTGRPLVEALRGRPGSARLVLVRWLLAIGAGLPGLLAARAALDGSVGLQPWFTEAPDPLPVAQTVGMFGELGAALPALAVGVVVAWLAQQLVTAAAVQVFDPRRPSEPVGLWRRTFDVGPRYLLPFLRVALVALVLLAVGAGLIGACFDALADRGELRGWSGRTMLLALPLARGACLLAWAGLVGMLASWARVIVAADERRHVRRALPAALRAWRRRPVQGLLAHWLAGGASIVVGAAVLVAWRQSPGGGTLWFVVWLAVLLLQAYVWHWRLLTLCLIWGSPDLAHVRRTPDQPWRFVRRLARRLRRASPARDAGENPTSPVGGL